MEVKVRTAEARNLKLVLTTIERCGTVVKADQIGLPEERK